MYKVFVTARVLKQNEEVFDILRENGCEIVPNPCYGRMLSEEELIQNLQGIDGLILGMEKINANILSKLDSLKVISRFGVGYDNVDVAAATAKGIAVTNVPGQNSESVAELAIAHMLAISRKIPTGWDQVRDGRWDIINGCELKDKTLGIMGLGRIGKSVALKAKAFNMKVIVYDRSAATKKADFCKENDIEIVSKEELLTRSDYVSLHMPGAAELKNFIGAEELNMMKPTAFLINTARGALVDEDALYTCLSEKRIAGAALDDLVNHPLQKDDKLLSLDNVIITPHMGANTTEANQRTKLMVIYNLLAGLTGEYNENTVNLAELKK